MMEWKSKTEVVFSKLE